MRLRTEVEKTLREFWLGKCENGAYHGCVIRTNKDKLQFPSSTGMTIEEATEKICKLLEE